MLKNFDLIGPLESFTYVSITGADLGGTEGAAALSFAE